MEWAAPQEQPHECPCGGERRWTEASGRATVAAWTIVRKAAHPAMAADVPYTLLVVRLAEGPCLISSLPGEGRRLEVGAEVEAFFEDVTADVALVRFRPRAAESNGRTGGKHGLAR
jgi:hypothetical protein